MQIQHKEFEQMKRTIKDKLCDRMHLMQSI